MPPLILTDDAGRPDLGRTLRVLAMFFTLAGHMGLLSALAKKMRARDALVAAAVSGGGGLIVGAVSVYAWGYERWYLTCAICGLAGWAGGNLVLDKLTWIAWTILRGYVPALRSPEKSKPNPESPRYGEAYKAIDLGLPELPPRRKRSV